MRRNKGLALAMVLLLVTFSAAGCGQKAQTADKAPLVKTQQAGSGSETDTGTYSGTVRGRYETNLSFQVGGQILSRNVQEGSRVKAGDTLMVINAKDVVQQANAGDAQVAQARAQMDLAQRNLARYSELYNQDAVAASVLDQYQANYDAAFATYQQALAQAAQGHNALGYTNLTAGADGVISKINAEEGQVVSAGQTVMTLVQTDELEVEIAVPENRIQDVAVGTPVKVSFWALSQDVDGTVREVSPMADSTSRTYKVRVSIPNPPEDMQLGMTASVTVAQNDKASSSGAVLPLSAIYQTGDTPEVWIVTKDNTVELRPVTVENFGDNTVLVHGLDPTDTVVTAGVHKLHEGEAVRTEADS